MCPYKGSGAKRIGKNGGDRYQTKQQGGLVCERASYRGRAEVIAFKWWVEKCGGGERFIPFQKCSRDVGLRNFERPKTIICL